MPGTTRDAIDTVFRRGETTFVLVDTAGLRRKRKQRQGIEYYSELRALDAADRADIALVLVDASEGLVDQDLAVADVARKANDATLVVLSKWDIGEIEGRGRAAAARATASASGPGSSPSRRRPAAASPACSTAIEELFTPRHDADLDAGAEQLPPGAARRPPAAVEVGRRRLNLLYGAQTRTRPPRFRFFVNDPGLVTRDYGYWVENQLRERFELEGVPVSIDFVRRS